MGFARSFRRIESWGMAQGHMGRLLRPRNLDELRSVIVAARREGVTLGPRGTGNSYGDASLNRLGWCLDMTGFSERLELDSAAGEVECDPGVTLDRLWRSILPSGFWPRVVTGTARPTLGGLVAVNAHGKNSYAVGPLGDSVVELDLVLASGESVTCSRQQNSELFHAVVGSAGALGILTRLRLEVTAVHSGDLMVSAFSGRHLGEVMADMESRRASADYLVAWLDAFAKGAAAGRGLVHHARYLKPGEDADPRASLSVLHQELPSRILGLLPRTEAWRLLRCVNHAPAMRLVNKLKQLGGRMEAMGESQLQSHASFAFLLDSLPHWKWAYGRRPGWGLIQHQLFVPHAAAESLFLEALERARTAGHTPFLAVLKRHRPDDFLLSHGMDGWSLALDFQVTPTLRESLWSLCGQLTDLTLEAGGRFYPAKDLVLTARQAERSWSPATMRKLRHWKAELDPTGLFSTDLWRRYS